MRDKKIEPNFKPADSLKKLRNFTNIKDNNLPGVEIIGAGYDIFDEYASTESITCQLFDWEKVPAKVVSFNDNFILPECVEANSYNKSITNKITESSIDEFQRVISNSFSISGSNKLKTFSGSLKADFSISELRNKKNYFSQIKQEISIWTISIRANSPKTLRDYLRKDIKDELDSLHRDSPDECFNHFFNTYGSHYINDLIMGGRVIVSASISKSCVKKITNFENAITAEYNKMTGQMKTRIDKEQENILVRSDILNSIIGGDSTKASKIFDPEDESSFSFWAETIRESPDFIAFKKEDNSLVGIWELCDTQDQKRVMKDYFESKWGPLKSKENQIKESSIITDILVLHNKKNAGRPIPPTGYTMINKNLNWETIGEYVQLCYAKKEQLIATDENFEGITDIKILYEDAKVPKGYCNEGTEVDLNKGNMGTDTYLYYKKESTSFDNLIKDIEIIQGDNEDIQPSLSYIKIKEDLNRHNTGKYTYICYKK